MSESISESIVISSSYFYRSLLRVSNVIVNKPLVPVLEDFLLEINGDTLKITTSDMSTTLHSFVSLGDKYNDTSTTLHSSVSLDDNYNDTSTTLRSSVSLDDRYNDTSTTLHSSVSLGDNYNDTSTTLHSSVSLDDRYDFKMAVPSKILLETLKNLPEQPIELSNDFSKNILTIKSSSGKYRIMCDDPKIYPIVNVGKSGNPISIVGKRLIEAIENTIVVASSDSLKPVINSVLFEISGNELISVATDIHRLIKYSIKFDNSFDNIRFIVPKRALSLLKNMLIDGEVFLYTTDRYVYLESGSDVFITALINDEYPDYERVIPKNYTNSLFINRFELLGSLKRLISFTNAINFQIKFNLSKNKLTLIAEDSNSENDAIEEIQCNYDCHDLMISYNVKYLLEILQVIKTDIVLMMFSNPNDKNVSNKATIIMPFENGDEPINYDFTALIMPIFI